MKEVSPCLPCLFLKKLFYILFFCLFVSDILVSIGGGPLEAVRIRDHALRVDELSTPDDFGVDEAPTGGEHAPGGGLSPLVDAARDESTENDHSF